MVRQDQPALTFCPFEELNLLKPLLGLIFRLVRSAEVLPGLLGYYFVAFLDFLDHEASCLHDAVKFRQAASGVGGGNHDPVPDRSFGEVGSSQDLIALAGSAATNLRLPGLKSADSYEPGRQRPKESEMP